MARFCPQPLKLTDHYDPNPDTNPEFNVKKGEGELTFKSEILEWRSTDDDKKNLSRAPHVPDHLSGVTIGAGFDLKLRNFVVVRLQLLKAGLTEVQATEFAKAACQDNDHNNHHPGTTHGLKGRDACNFIKDELHKTNLGYIIPAQQKKLFKLIYPGYVSELVKINFKPRNIKLHNCIIDWVRLTSEVKDLLVDLIFVGHYKDLTRGWIFPLLIRDDLAGIKALFADESKWLTAPSDPDHPTSLKIGPDRFKKRMAHANNLTKLFEPYEDRPEPKVGKFTFRLELLRGKRLIPEFVDSKLGVVIGFNFSLRKRQCWINSPGYGGDDRVKSKAEIKAFIKAVTDNESLSDLYSECYQFTTEDEFNKYKHDHPEIETKLAESQIKHLFELMYYQHEFEVLNVCNLDVIIKEYGVVDWCEVNQKIRDVVVDMSFTDHYGYRKKPERGTAKYQVILDSIQKHIVNNDLRLFTSAIEDLKNKKDLLARLGIPIDNWEDRFQKRISYLKSPIIEEACDERIPLIQKPGAWDSLPILEPAMPAYQIPFWAFSSLNRSEAEVVNALIENSHSRADLEFRTESRTLNGNDSELIKLPGIVPEMITIVKKPKENDHGNNLYDIQEIYLPVPGVTGLIAEQGKVESTNEIKVICEPENLNQIKPGMRLRYKLKNSEIYVYNEIRIVKDDIITVAEEIHLDELDSAKFNLDSSFFLPLNGINLSNLLGSNTPNIEITLSSPLAGGLSLADLIEVKENSLQIPLVVNIHVPQKKEDGQYDYQRWSAYCNIKLERLGPGDWRVSSNKIFLLFPPNKKKQVIDFGIASLVIPERPGIDLSKLVKSGQTPSQYDLCIDLETRELIFKFDTILQDDDRSLKLCFPGGMKQTNDDAELEKELEKRFVCHFKEVIEVKPDNSKISYFFRLNRKGISFHALVSSDKVFIEQGNSDTRSAVALQPEEKNNNITSEIEIHDNVIVKASLGAKMPFPGFKNLVADIRVELKKPTADAIPEVIAAMRLSTNDKSPIADLEFAMLRFQIDPDGLEMKIKWQGNKWDFSATASGSLSFTDKANLIADLEQLKALNAIRVKNLDLRKLNLKSIDIGLTFPNDEPVIFDILSGIFQVKFLGERDQRLPNGQILVKDDIIFSGASDVYRIISPSTQFNFKYESELAVDVKVGGLEIIIDHGKARIKVPRSIGLAVRLGPAVRFEGEFGWVDTPEERFMFASGSVAFEGFPEITALLKLGTVQKNSGKSAINLVIYGSMPLDIEIYPGVVVKSLGAGVGINNRLAAIDSDPTANEILANINLIRPEKIEGWSAVREGDLYLSIVGSAILAANSGDEKQIQPYVAELILSLDTNLDVIAAGRLWLSSSVEFAKAHRENPVLLGALALSLRRKALSAALETGRNPAIESGQQLQKILQKAHLRFDFRLTPDLVDYYLRDISYQDDFLGVQMLFAGYYRVAIFRNTALMKAGMHIEGSYSTELRAGPGGFSFSGSLSIFIEYAGLLSTRGIVVYGILNAQLPFSVSAFIEITLGFTIGWGRWKKRIQKTFHYSISLNVGLHFMGVAAIVETGRVGFEGTVSISVRICGYGLSISPRLAISPDVISEARQRVAAFERQLDLAIKTAEGRLTHLRHSGSAHSMIGAPMTPLFNDRSALKKNSIQKDNRWLYYKNDSAQRHVFLPNSESTWLTPKFEGLIKDSNFEYRNGVYKITTTDDIRLSPDDQIFIHYLSKSERNNIVINEIVKITAVQNNTATFTSDNPKFKIEEAGYKITWNRTTNNGLPNFVDDVQTIAIPSTDSRYTVSLMGDIQFKKSANIISVKSKTVQSYTKGSLIILTCDKYQGLCSVESVSGKDINLKPFLGLPVQENSTIPANTASALIIPQIILYAPWNKAARDAFCKIRNIDTLDEDQIQDTLELFFESSRDYDLIEQFDELEIISDPRLETLSRDFVRKEKQHLPEHVLSAEFRSYSELVGDSQVTADHGMLDKIFKYEQLRNRQVAITRHSNNDESDIEQVKQIRSRIIDMVIRELQSPGEKPRFFKFSTPVTSSNEVETQHILGLIFETNKPIALTENKEQYIYINRSNGDNERIEVFHPDDTSALKVLMRDNKIKPLYVRQDVSHTRDESLDVIETKATIRLPIKIDDRLLRSASELAKLGSFQICRQITEGGKPLPIADFVYPIIETCKERVELHVQSNIQVKNVSFKITVNEELVEVKETRCELVMDSEKAANLRIHDNLHLQLKKDQVIHESKIHYLSFENNTATFVLESPVATGQYDAIVRKITNALILDPYLFTDTLYVKNNSLYYEKIDPETKRKNKVPLNVPAHNTKIIYSLNIISTSLNQNFKNAEQGLQAEFPPFQLYIPPYEKLPDSLAIVMPVQSLVLGESKYQAIFHLINQETNAPLTLDEIKVELWVKETPLKRTGYYAGDSDVFTPEGNVKEAFLDEVRNIHEESIDGKIRVPAIYNETLGSFLIDNPQAIFRLDCGYQFYARPVSQSESLLYPLQHRIIRMIPNSWYNISKQRTVQQIEWISASMYDHIRNRLFNESIIPTDRYIASGRYHDSANFIKLNFMTDDINVGGVEAFIIDDDAPNQFAQIMAEILEEDVFKQHIKDYRNNSIWRLCQYTTPLDSNDQLPIGSAGDCNYNDYFDFEKTKSTLIRNLKLHLEIAQTKLKEFSQLGSYDWQHDLLPVLYNVLYDFLQFEKSSLNIHLPALTDRINNIRNLFGNLVLGANPAVNVTASYAFLIEIEDKVKDKQRSAVSSIDFLDYQYAKQLTGILRRRMACIQDLFALTHPINFPNERILNINLSSVSEHESLPAEFRWSKIKNDYDNSSAEDREKMELTRSIFENYTVSNIAVTINKLVDVDHGEISSLQTLMREEYGRSIASIVPHATKLAGLLDKIKENTNVAKLIKHPHHNVNVESNREGTTVAKPVNLAAFLPDAAKLQDGLKQLKIEVTEQFKVDFNLNTSLIAYFNLLEYLGFAVDISALNALQMPLEQNDLIDVIKDAISVISAPDATDPDNSSDYLFFILRSVASNAFEPQEERGAMNFVKLAMVPKKFHFSATNFDPKATNGNQSLITWLRQRNICGIDTQNDADLINLNCLNTIAKYLNTFINKRSDTDFSKKVSVLTFELAAQRWVTLPAIASKTQLYWKVPDNYGHRYRVVLREVSRYEQLVAWEMGIKENSLVNRYNIQSLNDYGKTVHVLPVYPTGKHVREQMLPIYVYPHPSKVQFSYQLPVDAARALKNQISSIRSGYKGHDLAFRYAYIDNLKRKTAKILLAIEKKDEVLTLPEQCRKFIDRETNQTINTYDHERLLTLPHLPYYYRYYLTARANYLAHNTAESHFDRGRIIQPAGTSGNEEGVNNIRVAASSKSTLPSQPWLLEFWKVDAGDENKLLEIVATVRTTSVQIEQNGGQPCYCIETESRLREPDIANTFCLLYEANEKSGMVQPAIISVFKATLSLIQNNPPTPDPGNTPPDDEPGHDEPDNSGDTEDSGDTDTGDSGDSDDSENSGNSPEVPGNSENPALRMSLVEEPPESLIEYTFKIFLNRNHDYLTQEQVDNQPPLLLLSSVSDDGSGPYNAEDSYYINEIPDLTTNYQVYYKIDKGENDPNKYYVPFLTLAMPWSSLYSEDKTASSTVILPQIMGVAPYLKVFDIVNEAPPSVPTKQKNVKIRRQRQATQTDSRYLYTIEFKVIVMDEHRKTGLFLDPKKFIIEAIRDGNSVHTDIIDVTKHNSIGGNNESRR